MSASHQYQVVFAVTSEGSPVVANYEADQVRVEDGVLIFATRWGRVLAAFSPGDWVSVRQIGPTEFTGVSQ